MDHGILLLMENPFQPISEEKAAEMAAKRTKRQREKMPLLADQIPDVDLYAIRRVAQVPFARRRRHGATFSRPWRHSDRPCGHDAGEILLPAWLPLPLEPRQFRVADKFGCPVNCLYNYLGRTAFVQRAAVGETGNRPGPLSPRAPSCVPSLAQPPAFEVRPGT
jgi:hypothetical protein